MYNLSYNPDNMDQFVTQLQELGLGEHESLVYSTLTRSSPASATFIAKKCALSRSSVYTTLSSLVSKGLVGTTHKNDIKQFIAQDHGALEALVKKEKESVEKKTKLVETLKKTLYSAPHDMQLPHVVFFEGQEGLKKIYLSMMRQAPEKATLYLLRDEFVWQPEWKFIFDLDWHARVKRWKTEKDIRTKLLINPSLIEKDHAKFYKTKKALEVRYLPTTHMVQQFAIYVLGDTIAILSMESNNLMGIQIVNAHVANNYRNMFAALWDGSNKR